jgi:integrase
MKTQLKPSTWDSYTRNLRLHVLPRIGHRVLQQINAAMLNELYAALLADGNARGGGLSAKTVRYIHTTIHKALADAADAGVLGANAAERARPPKLGKTRVSELRFWQPEELRTFLELVDGTRVQAAWHVAAMTGMRRGEVLGLRWKDVDFDSARISVRHTIVSVAYEVQSSTPKTHQARVIDLDAGTVEQLRRHRERQQFERTNWADDYEERDLVFCRENGSPLHPDSFSQTFERTIARSALPRIRLHDLRHTHATIALRAGVPIKVISERLGHESPAFTMKQYAHVLPGMQAEAASRIAQLVGGALPVRRR